MPKSKGQPGPKKPRRAALSPTEKLQRDSLKLLRDELIEWHYLSIDVMTERGILPPLYGGEYLGDTREIIPLWGFENETDLDPSLSIVLLRVVNNNEPCAELREMREDLGLTNDWPVVDLMNSIMGAARSKIEGSEHLEGMSIFLVLGGDQLQPAPGYSRETMIDHMAAMRPYAVFPIVPVTGEADDLTYHWEDLEHFRAEVVYADNWQLLEAAVWSYRLRMALDAYRVDIEAEGDDPNEEMVAPNIYELIGLYDTLVMGAVRLYGATSPVRAQQEKLDILHEDNGDLIVRAPLKPEIEPVNALRDERQHIHSETDGLVLHILGETEMMDSIWPQIRPNRYYSIRIRYGVLSEYNQRVRVRGFAERPYYEWYVADTLEGLYEMVHLVALREFLTLSGLIQPIVKRRANVSKWD